MEIANQENPPISKGMSRVFFEHPCDGALWTIELVKLTGKWYVSIVVDRAGTKACRFCLTLAHWRHLIDASGDLTKRLSATIDAGSEEHPKVKVLDRYQLWAADQYQIMMDFIIDGTMAFLDLTVYKRNSQSDEFKRTLHSIRLDGGSWMMLLQQVDEVEKCVKFLEGFGDKLDGMSFSNFAFYT